jgi:murein DD-endopeptidase MepM/ murein hydrolase activator NlpD
MTDYKDVRSHLIRFEMLTNEIAELVDDIKPNIEYIYELSKGDNDVYKIWESAPNGGKESEDLSKMKDLLPEEIYLLRDLQTDLICTTKTVKTIKNFIDVRSRVIQDVPSIIPNLGHISSLFGWRRSPFGFGRDFHTGIDIAAAPGEPIKATAPGIVTTVGWGGGFGWMVKIDHKYGFQSLYGHCKITACRVGQEVKKGQIVAYVGQTGSATGNHCHYEIRLGGSPINPYPYMSKIW